MWVVRQATNMKYDLTVFQEPRGVMRIFQFVRICSQMFWNDFNLISSQALSLILFSLFSLVHHSTQIFAICALYTTVNFESEVNFDCKTKPNGKSIIDYPFRFNENVCPKAPATGANATAFALSIDVSSDAQFFVATSVLSILYCIFIGSVYALIDDMYKNKSEIPLAVSIAQLSNTIIWRIGF